MRKLMLILVLLLAPLHSNAAQTYLYGTISNITAASDGLLVMLDTGIPGNCTGTPANCMKIPESNKTLMATALLMWITNNRVATLYTSGIDGSGFCIVNQYDPQ